MMKRGRYRWEDRSVVPMTARDKTGRPTGEEICLKCQGRGQIGGQECPQCGGSGKTIDAIGEE